MRHLDSNSSNRREKVRPFSRQLQTYIGLENWTIVFTNNDGAERSLEGFTKERSVDLVLIKIVRRWKRKGGHHVRNFRVELNPSLRVIGEDWIELQRKATADLAALQSEIVKLPTAALRRFRKIIEGFKRSTLLRKQPTSGKSEPRTRKKRTGAER